MEKVGARLLSPESQRRRARTSRQISAIVRNASSRLDFFNGRNFFFDNFFLRGNVRAGAAFAADDFIAVAARDLRFVAIMRGGSPIGRSGSRKPIADQHGLILPRYPKPLIPAPKLTLVEGRESHSTKARAAAYRSRFMCTCSGTLAATLGPTRDTTRGQFRTGWGYRHPMAHAEQSYAIRCTQAECGREATLYIKFTLIARR